MSSSRRVTIADVAHAAGVSPTAVSFAFNHPDRIATETTLRIFATARQLGYWPDLVARALHSGRTNVIGVLVPFSLSASFANLSFSAFMGGVGAACEASRLNAVIISWNAIALEEAVTRTAVDGYIIVGLDESHPKLQHLLQRSIPLVIVDGVTETISSVNTAEEAGAFAAADHLLAAGHRDILVITTQAQIIPSEDSRAPAPGGQRLAGYQRAFAAYGLILRPEQIRHAMPSVEGGVEAFSAAWNECLRPSALLVDSDTVAIGAIAAAQQCGLCIPAELEVIGFDDVPLAALTQPALSTVHQPVMQQGQLAAELLAQTLTDSRIVRQILLPTTLTLRASTR